MFPFLRGCIPGRISSTSGVPQKPVDGNAVTDKKAPNLPVPDENLKERARLKDQQEAKKKRVALEGRLPPIHSGGTVELEATTQAASAEPVSTAPPSKKKLKARLSIPLTGSRLELVGSSHGFFRTKMRVRPNWAGKKDTAELTAYVYGNKGLSQAERDERLQIANKIVDCQTNPKSAGKLEIAKFNNVTELPVIPANVRELYISDMASLEKPPVIADPKPGEPGLRDYTIAHCDTVEGTPDISKHPNLQKLVLDHCKKLDKIPHVGSESRLEFLQMSNCGTLKKPEKQFEGNHLEKVLIDHKGDYLTDKQMRKLDYLDREPYVMDNMLSSRSKTPPEDRDPPEASVAKTSDRPSEWRDYAKYQCI